MNQVRLFLRRSPGEAPTDVSFWPQRATDCPECRYARSKPDANEVNVTTKLAWYRSSPEPPAV
jgi:hypothetical protein